MVGRMSRPTPGAATGPGTELLGDSPQRPARYVAALWRSRACIPRTRWRHLATSVINSSYRCLVQPGEPGAPAGGVVNKLEVEKVSLASFGRAGDRPTTVDQS